MPIWAKQIIELLLKVVAYPLIKEAIDDYRRGKKMREEQKRLEEEARRAAEAHSQSTVENSTGSFGDLPAWAFIFLIPILSSCQSGSAYLKTEQCSPAFKYVEVEVVVENGGVEKKKMIDIAGSRCNCRPYEFSITRVAPTGSPYIKQLEYCDRMVGNTVSEYARVQPFWEAVRKDIVEGQSDDKGGAK